MSGRNDDSNATTLPPRIKAAFDFLNHAYYVTTQTEASIPARELSPLEKSVETAALRALQQYLLGEMDFVESSEQAKPIKGDDEDGSASTPADCTP